MTSCSNTDRTSLYRELQALGTGDEHRVGGLPPPRLCWIAIEESGELAAGVLQSVALAGFPTPELVEVSTAGMITGAVNLRPRELPRRAEKGDCSAMRESLSTSRSRAR